MLSRAGLALARLALARVVQVLLAQALLVQVFLAQALLALSGRLLWLRLRLHPLLLVCLRWNGPGRWRWGRGGQGRGVTGAVVSLRRQQWEEGRGLGLRTK